MPEDQEVAHGGRRLISLEEAQRLQVALLIHDSGGGSIMVAAGDRLPWTRTPNRSAFGSLRARSATAAARSRPPAFGRPPRRSRVVASRNTLARGVDGSASTRGVSGRRASGSLAGSVRTPSIAARKLCHSADTRFEAGRMIVSEAALLGAEIEHRIVIGVGLRIVVQQRRERAPADQAEVVQCVGRERPEVAQVLRTSGDVEPTSRAAAIWLGWSRR